MYCDQLLVRELWDCDKRLARKVIISSTSEQIWILIDQKALASIKHRVCSKFAFIFIILFSW